MWKKKKYMVIMVVCLLAMLSFFAIKHITAPLTVDGIPVSQQEIDFHSGNMEWVIRSKVLLNWAVEAGIADAFSEETFSKDLQAENKEREEIHRAGGTLYGPVQFTPLQYYKKQMSTYEQQLKENIMQKATPQAQLAFYEAHREDYRQIDTIYADYTVWQENRIVDQGSITLDSKNIRALTESDEELVQYLLQLEEGGQLSWTSEDGSEKQLQCTKREPGRTLSYEEVAGAVLEQYVAAQFEQKLNEKIEQSKIRGLR